MNWDEISGGWTQVKGKAREQWGELTDSDLERIGGTKDQLVGLLRQRYGHLRGAAERELDEWAAALEPVPSAIAPSTPSASEQAKASAPRGDA